MKMSDMQRTKAEKTAEGKRYKDGPSMGGEDYPHGIHIEFDHDGLKKIGIDDMPKPGDEYHGEFHGRVTEASENSDENSDQPRRRVRMVMHKIGMEPKDSDEKAGPDIRKAVAAAKQ